MVLYASVRRRGGPFRRRWNPPGLPAIYAARELSTAWAEYNQGFVQHPALIAQLELAGARLADLTVTAVMKKHGFDQVIHRSEWRSELDEGEVPAPHLVYRQLFGAGFDGVIYPSFMSPGGSCVALWRWNGLGAPVCASSIRMVDFRDRRRHGDNSDGVGARE